MKMKKLKISIFMLIISLMIGCFMFTGNNIGVAYAAENISQCYYLISNNTPYKSNSVVGNATGAGKYVVGTDNVVINATANENYQLVGWQITYKDRADETIFIDSNNLVSDEKSVVLETLDDGTEISASFKFVRDDRYFKSGTLSLSYVFENLEIAPVFDFIYYKVNVNNLVLVSGHSNSMTLGGNTLYYEEEVNNEGVTNYTNAYLKVDENYYFYGNLYKEKVNGEDFYYTIHETQTANPEEEKVDYIRGAYRVGETVDLYFNVNIDSADIKNSCNIDLISVKALSENEVVLNEKTEDQENGYFVKNKDEFKRTENYQVNFNIESQEDYVNNLVLNYHSLFVVDLVLKVDGNGEHNEHADLFGTIETFENALESNISLFNFYSKTTEDNLQYLVKKSAENDYNTFMVSSVKTIGKTIEGVNYKYYDFVSIDGDVNNNSKSFANITSNIEVVIDYTSVKYNIDFNFVICEKDAGDNWIYNLSSGNVLETVVLKRGETATFDAESVEDLENVGYKFLGFAGSLTDAFSSEITYAVDKSKPKDTTILLCYEKLEYTLIFTNYNQVKIGENVAINTATFNITRNQNVLQDVISPKDLTEPSVQVLHKIKLDDTISIATRLNNGFDIYGYSLTYLDNPTKDDCFTSFEFNQAFIKDNNLSETITIYVFEKFLTYEITYYIEPTFDSKAEQDVFMANINAEATNAVIKKYDKNNVLISESNNNLTAMVVKIIISELKLEDEVKLISSPVTIGEGEGAYTYVFNWFTEDDKSTLSFEDDGNFHNHIEKVSRSREIKVVYSMPNTRVLITIEEEYAANANFSFDIELVQNGEVILPEAENVKAYLVEVGADVSISLSNLSFGYNFIGYTVNNTPQLVSVNGLSFEYSAIAGVNNITLIFNQIEYRFEFIQFGAGMDGDLVQFAANNYVNLSIDNATVEIEKPEGYYVASVTFANGVDKYSSDLSETNNFKNNNDIITYNFSLTREQFEDLVKNYSNVVEINENEVTVVNVRLDYLIFTYSVEVAYSLTNPKNDSRDDNVNFPSIEMLLEYDQVTEWAVSTYNNKKITFIKIPYGAKATLQVMSGAPTGLSVTGWRYANDDIVLQEEYPHSLNQLIISRVLTDKSFKYKLTYIAYELNLSYKSEQGDPQVFINNNLIKTETKQVTLYDKIQINANALREKGYKFKAFKYKVPIYTAYSFNADTWATEYMNLYIQNEQNYELNISSVYDAGKTYYTYTEREVEITDETFIDESFHISNYALNDKKISIVIEYELLKFTIEKTIAQTAQKATWSLTSMGKESAKIAIDKETFATFEVQAKDSRTNIPRTIEANTENYYVTFYDVVTITITINRNAANSLNSEVFDLSLGLTLETVKISGVRYGAVDNGGGQYTLVFNVGELMPDNGEIITIDYTFKIQSKEIKAYTKIKDSTDFYKNIKFTVNASDYGFDQRPTETTSGANNLTQSFQFLAKARVYTTFTSDNYKQNFKISGVKVYYNGQELTDDERIENGIEVIDGAVIISRLLYNIEVEFNVQPIITFNGGPAYKKVFSCDNNGVGVAQKLIMGSDASCDIQLASIIADCLVVEYVEQGTNSYPTNSVVNVGEYDVKISFNSDETYDWLEQVEIAENVTLTILQKDIHLTYDNDAVVKVEKTYDGSSEWSAESIYKYLVFTDNLSINLRYSNLVGASDSRLTITSAQAFISTAGKDGEIKVANENVYYNLYVYNITLSNNTYNNNFNLVNKDLIINGYIKILRAEIKLVGLQVYDKVYDGTDVAQLAMAGDVTIANLVPGDIVSFDASNISIKFADPEVGVDKVVAIDAQDAFSGRDAANYYIKDTVVTGLTIYPYEISAEFEGVGKISIINKRGLTDYQKVGLIPINATLRVVVVRPDSVEYANIYKNISEFLRGNSEFSMGYKLEMVVDGRVVNIDNDLYLSVPRVRNLTGTYFLTGSRSGEINYTLEGNSIVVDLKQINENVNYVFLTQKKILLKAWQIALIVSGAGLVILGVVLTFVIVRKRKLDRYSINEKI